MFYSRSMQQVAPHQLARRCAAPTRRTSAVTHVGSPAEPATGDVLYMAPATADTTCTTKADGQWGVSWCVSKLVMPNKFLQAGSVLAGPCAM